MISFIVTLYRSFESQAVSLQSTRLVTSLTRMTQAGWISNAIEPLGGVSVLRVLLSKRCQLRSAERCLKSDIIQNGDSTS